MWRHNRFARVDDIVSKTEFDAHLLNMRRRIEREINNNNNANIVFGAIDNELHTCMIVSRHMKCPMCLKHLRIQNYLPPMLGRREPVKLWE